jgi:hypothetical protein
LPEVGGKMKEKDAKRQEKGRVASLNGDACSDMTVRCTSTKLPPVQCHYLTLETR